MKQDIMESYKLLAERVSAIDNVTELPSKRDRQNVVAASNTVLQGLTAIPSLESNVRDLREKYQQLSETVRPVEHERISLETLNRDVVGTNPIDWVALTFCGSVPILQTFFMFNFLLGFPRVPAGLMAFVAIFILFNYIGSGLKAAFVRIVEYSVMNEEPNPQVKSSSWQLSKKSRRDAVKVPVDSKLKQLQWEATEILLVLFGVDAAVSLGFPALTASLVPGIDFDLSTVGLCILSLAFDYAGSRVIRQQVERNRPALRRRLLAMEETGDSSFDSKLAKLRATYYSLRREKREAKWECFQAKSKADQNERSISQAVAVLNMYEGKIVALRTTRDANLKKAERSAKPPKEQSTSRPPSRGRNRNRGNRW